MTPDPKETVLSNPSSGGSGTTLTEWAERLQRCLDGEGKAAVFTLNMPRNDAVALIAEIRDLQAALKERERERDAFKRGQDYQLHLAELARADRSKAESALLASQEEAERMRKALEWFVDRKDSLQAKFDLHGPLDMAVAMRENFKRATAALSLPQQVKP